MANTTIYTIESTDGESVLVIQPRTWNGQSGVFRDTDLTFYGNATPNWGEMFNENFYRLLENFATEEQSSNMPKNESNIGIQYRGINNPVEGQIWYNKSDGHIYIQRRETADVEALGPDWERLPTDEDVGNLAISGVDGLQGAMDAKVDVAGDTMTGRLHVNTTTSNLTDSTPLKVSGEGHGPGGESASSYNGGNYTAMLTSGSYTDSGGLLIEVGDNNNDEWAVKIENPNPGISAYTGLPANRRVFGIKATTGDIYVGQTARVYLSGPPGSDNEAATRKFVEDEVASQIGNGFVAKQGGDAMEGPLTIEDYDNVASDFSLRVRSNTGANISLYSEEATQGASAPPSIVLYNSDNDNLLTGRPSNYYPYSRWTNRDGTFMRLEVDRDDIGSSVGSNTYTILEMSQQNGIMQYFGRSMDPDTSFTNVIRTPNASPTDVADHPHNLTTREYVDQEIAALASSGIHASVLNTNGYIWFENGFVMQWGQFASFSNGGSKNYSQDVALPLSGMTQGFAVTVSIYNTSYPSNTGDNNWGGRFLSGFDTVRFWSRMQANTAPMAWMVYGFRAV